MRKYMLAAFLAVFVFAFLPSMQAQAQSSDGFELDGTGTVTLRSQHAAKEKVSSLQFSLTVESAEAVQVDFEFGQNNARLAEFRYDENEKKLNIYMAGVDALFAENTDALTIGKVIIRNGSGEEAAAKVSVVEDSLQYVYGTELKQMDDVEIPAAVQLGEVPQETPPPVNTPEPVQTPDPGAQETPNPGPQQTPDPGTQNPPDSGNQDDDDDPNDGWNPGWEESNNNSNGTSQSSGNNRKPSKTQVASTASRSPQPSTSPEVSVSPSPQPESSSEEELSVEDVEDISSEEIPSEEEINASAEAPTEEETSGQAVESENGIDWILVVVIIAIVIFVAVAAISIVVLKGKKDSDGHRN